MDSGQPKLSFAVRNSYKERAQRYYYTYSQASDLNEAREALDSIIKAVFYNANEWVYWACASAAFLDRAEREAVYDPSRAELYAKFAMAMNPRDPYPYARLVAAYFALGQFEESDRIATRALEVGRFERPHFSSYQGDDGRAYFNDYKGRCCLRTGDVARARDYLLTAFTLGRSAEVVQPYLCEALVALAKNLKPLKIGESKGLGFDLGIMDNQYVILRLAENSVARSAGLQVGDCVVHVDGVPSITRQNYSRVTQAIDALLSGQREQVLLEVRRDDQVMLFLVTK
jgi:tetratricopeptide (TPR) repeat protein